MWTNLPFHVHSQSHQPVACAECDILYGPPLHLYTTASCTVSVGGGIIIILAEWETKLKEMFNLFMDFWLCLADSRIELLFPPFLSSSFWEEECVIANQNMFVGFFKQDFIFKTWPGMRF